MAWSSAPPLDRHACQHRILATVYSMTLAGAGALVASRVSGDAIGWLFCGFGQAGTCPLGVGEHGVSAAA